MRKTIASSDELDNLPVGSCVSCKKMLLDLTPMTYFKDKEGWRWEGNGSPRESTYLLFFPVIEVIHEEDILQLGTIG